MFTNRSLVLGEKSIKSPNLRACVPLETNWIYTFKSILHISDEGYICKSELKYFLEGFLNQIARFFRKSIEMTTLRGVKVWCLNLDFLPLLKKVL